MGESGDFALSCPVPIARYPRVLLAHGGGGRLMRQLIKQLIVPAFGPQALGELHDGAKLELPQALWQPGAALAFTTDSFVVSPLFFPGGDIGVLAVNGTVNDLAMCGARPLYLSVALIIEEGLPMETLRRVMQSMRDAAEKAGVTVVTGDTKVVEHGKGDGLFITTSGIGIIPPGQAMSPSRVRAGDLVLVNGDLGRHGIAIMSVREGLQFESVIESDTAPLADLVALMLDSGADVHCLRDLTRGGLVSALNEIAESAGVPVGSSPGLGIEIDEEAIPVRQDVEAACEMLGLDPLYVANEGRFIAFVAQKDAERVLDVMQRHPLGKQARIIGRVVTDHPGQVVMKTRVGTRRVLDMLSGEQLPRIC